MYMKRLSALLICACLLLSGCSALFSGSYYHTEPHLHSGSGTESGNISASNYAGLCHALVTMVENGTQSGIISVPDYDQNRLQADIDRAITDTLSTSPIAAWAVEALNCEVGSSGGQSAIAVNITYRHDRAEIRRIRRADSLEVAKAIIHEVLDECGTGVVMLMQNFQDTDFEQLVEDYADISPQTVMECPQVVANVYPDNGDSRLVELKFTYQTSRDSLRSMQTQVRSVFESAAVYVSGYEQESEKFRQLYAFLMEFLVEGDYKQETSITPAYSLLRHGVGNEKAFATVYAAMCKEAGLECRVIIGTRSGEPWYWNQICIDGVYSHLDLLRCSKNGKFQTYPDDKMDGYVWDYSAYPVSE